MAGGKEEEAKDELIVAEHLPMPKKNKWKKEGGIEKNVWMELRREGGTSTGMIKEEE